MSEKSFNKWVVNACDKAKYDEVFQLLDQDFDGYVTGAEVKNTFVASGVQQHYLAHIWDLCDVRENGKLNSEQFALAMYLIKQKQNGFDLPVQLPPDMVPPTLRPKPIIGFDSQPLQEPFNTMSTNDGLPLQTLSGNKELDTLAEELKDLQIEKLKLESEVHEEEQCLKLRQSEIKNLQNEIETMYQMLKQLDTQKLEASKRLDDLSSQNKILETTVIELSEKIMEDKVKVENMCQQLEEQKLKVESQESELMYKQKELQNLKSEESKLELQLESYKREVEITSRSAGDTQLEISHIRTKLIEVEEYERQLNGAINDINIALESNDILKINSLLPRTITPPITEFQTTQKQNGFSNMEKITLSKDPITEFVDPFAGEDPFRDDPFRNRADPFTGGFVTFESQTGSEPFDPFGTGSFNASNKSDPFGSEPFQSQNCEIRSESPTAPALPPKRGKAPPPRPAPPKQSNSSNKTPLRAAPAPPVANIANSEEPFKESSSLYQTSFDPFNDNKDPFSSTGVSSNPNFANFANFDNFAS